MDWLDSYFVDEVGYEEFVGDDNEYKVATYKPLVTIKCRLDVNITALERTDSTVDFEYMYTLITNYPVVARSLINGQNIKKVRKITGFNGQSTYVAYVGGSE